LTITPELRAGDALFVRADLFHCTQDNETSRIALSVRLWNDNDVIDKDMLFIMSKNKYERMRLERINFSNVLGTFWRWGADRITLGQYKEFMDRCEKKRPLELFFKLMAYLFFPMILKKKYQMLLTQRTLSPAEEELPEEEKKAG